MLPVVHCACGKPLHYADPERQRLTEEYVARFGPDAKIIVGDRAWAVPRHYIALHGLMAFELPDLAKKFGFKELEP